MGYKGTTDTTLSLFAAHGERKYLNAAERVRFLAALEHVICPLERTFCALIFWTGCRPSEALNTDIAGFDIEAGTVIFQSLKKRGGRHFRAVPLPRDFLAELDRVHGIRAAQSKGGKATACRLWRFSRTKGWMVMARVMKAAGVSGIRACARGLRHSFGVHAILSKVPEMRVKQWLGHASLATTQIYVNLAAMEDRQVTRRMWGTSQPFEGQGTWQEKGSAVSRDELVRLVCAYSAIPDTEPRMDLLNRIEASAHGREAEAYAY